MTFCVAVKTIYGLVALADTRIVNGSERTSKSKVSQLEHSSGPLFFMTSGLRSIRDKTSVYFENELSNPTTETMSRLFQAANLLGNCLRRVRYEDGDSLIKDNLRFNVHAIIGGQFVDDPAPLLFYIYPQGNWVEATADAPYHVIGRTPYCKPILDQFLTAESSLAQATILSFLAFDATRVSVTDVDFPVDMVVLDSRRNSMIHRRFDAEDLAHTRKWWQSTLNTALNHFPLDWAQQLLGAGASGDLHNEQHQNRIDT